MHVSWFETEMALETLESMLQAAEHTSLPVEVHLCFNAQTFLESPIEGEAVTSFDILLQHPKAEEWNIVWKNNKDGFYNVGDWRRDCYDNDNLTVWGESDCLVPVQYFAYIEHIHKVLEGRYPYIVTLQQKKMWDSSWTPTEHKALQNLTLEQVRAINNKFVTGEGFLSLEELNTFNTSFDSEITLKQSNYYKGDGALICLSPDMPHPFIAEGLHMCGEDTYFFNYCALKRVSLYTVDGLMKGHNTGHPKKRVNRQQSTEQKEQFRILDSQMRELAQKSLQQLQ